MSASTSELLERRLRTLFREQLNVELPTEETDLLDSGLVDSLMVVELLLHIEQQLGITLPMEGLEIDDFRTLGSIARCVECKGQLIV